MKRSLLIILDGWGINHDAAHNAIIKANPLFWNKLLKEFPNSALNCSEESVGLSKGFLSNSEVGHMAIGAGRVVAQTSFAIDRAIEKGEFDSNPVLCELRHHLDQFGGALHFFGLLSDAGVHAHIRHLVALIEWAKKRKLDQISIHLCSDGRDMAPMSAASSVIPELEKHLTEGIRISTLCGRVFGMDRTENWDRTLEAYKNMTGLSNKTDERPREYLERNYKDGITDEFVQPARFDDTVIKDNDAVVFFNFRADRMRQMAKLFLNNAPGAVQQEVEVPKNLFLASSSNYDDKFTGVHVFFSPDIPVNTLGEWISRKGLKQFRVTETEKYAHLTYFLNGGRELKFENEERLMIPSLGLKNYATNPELSLEEIANTLIRVIENESFDFLACNIANGDMVGHCGDITAGIKAVKHVDKALSRIVPIAMAHNYGVIITADHGNIELVRENDRPHTAHTWNDVPFIVLNTNFELPKFGFLNQVAPTILDIMGVQIPKEMTSGSLIRPPV